MTYRNVDGEQKMSNYVELMNVHNHTKHWVDDVNNRRPDSVSLG